MWYRLNFKFFSLLECFWMIPLNFKYPPISHHKSLDYHEQPEKRILRFYTLHVFQAWSHISQSLEGFLVQGIDFMFFVCVPIASVIACILWNHHCLIICLTPILGLWAPRGQDSQLILVCCPRTQQCAWQMLSKWFIVHLVHPTLTLPLSVPWTPIQNSFITYYLFPFP